MCFVLNLDLVGKGKYALHGTMFGLVCHYDIIIVGYLARETLSYPCNIIRTPAGDYPVL